MKRFTILLIWLLSGMVMQAQPKTIDLSQKDLQTAEMQLKTALKRVTQYIVQIGTSPDRCGVPKERKEKILKNYIPNLFYMFSYRQVTVTNVAQNTVKYPKAPTYFTNLMLQSLRESRKVEYEVEPDEIYLSGRPNSLRFVDINTEGVARYVTNVSFLQIYKSYSNGPYDERTHNNLIVEKERKSLRCYILIDHEGDIMVKLGNIFASEIIK